LSTLALPIAKIAIGVYNSWLAIKNMIFMKLAIEKKTLCFTNAHSKCLFSDRIKRQKHR
jgi:uncharacterized membrane protein YiaA